MAVQEKLHDVDLVSALSFWIIGIMTFIGQRAQAHWKESIEERPLSAGSLMYRQLVFESLGCAEVIILPKQIKKCHQAENSIIFFSKKKNITTVFCFPLQIF